MKEKDRFMSEYIQLYKGVIEKAVKENDKWHIWLFSSPSNGNKVTNILNQNPQDNNFGDGKYQVDYCLNKCSQTRSVQQHPRSK